MAKIDIDTLKTAFERGDRPTQQDYVNLIDTLAAQATDLGSSGNNELEVNGIESETVIDSFNILEWRMVKYLVSISKTTDGDNKFYVAELSVLIDGTDINVTEYGVLDNDGDIGTVSVSRNGNSFELRITPNPNIRPVTARYARMGLKA
jgi:flagellar motor component MotA